MGWGNLFALSKPNLYSLKELFNGLIRFIERFQCVRDNNFVFKSFKEISAT